MIDRYTRPEMAALWADQRSGIGQVYSAAIEVESAAPPQHISNH